MASDKLLQNLHDRMRNESTAAETEWANATRVVTAARAKDDELRAEVKWRAAERAAAERAASEAESRHQMAKEALAQAEKQCMLAAAAATQKQSSLRQLAEFESAIELQAKLAEQAKTELQQIKPEVSARQQEVQTLRQDLCKLRELYDEKCQRQVFTKEHDALAQQLEAIRGELAAAKASNGELQASLRQEKADREQLAAELSSTRARELGLEGELAALRRAVSCAKTEASLLRAKLAAPPSPSVYPQPARPAPPDPRQSGGEPEMGTSMASWSAPKAEPQLMDNKQVDFLASDFPPRLKIQPTTRSDIIATNKPLSPEGAAVVDAEPSKRKLSSSSQALPPARVDEFPDTQQDDKPHVKRARFSDPGIQEPPFAGVCKPESSASPLHAAKPSAADAGLSPSGPGPGPGLRPPLRSLGDRHPTQPKGVPCKRQSAGPSGQPATPAATNSGKRYMRTKEEVLRLARSMYSTKPTAKQLRNPPLKLYPAHVDYVLATWDRCPPGGSEAGASGRATARPAAFTTSINTNSGMHTSWQHVQHFLQLQNAQSSRDSLGSVRVVSSVR